MNKKRHEELQFLENCRNETAVLYYRFEISELAILKYLKIKLCLKKAKSVNLITQPRLGLKLHALQNLVRPLVALI